MGAAAVQEAHRRMRRLIEDLCECYETSPRDIPPVIVYNELRCYAVNVDAEPSATVRALMNALWPEIQQAPSYRQGGEMPTLHKRCFLLNLLHTAHVAAYHKGCIRYPKGPGSEGFRSINVQVVDCAVEQGLFIGWPSPAGSPKMSRLIPTPKLQKLMQADPWQFDPHHSPQYVTLYRRHEHQDLITLPQIQSLRDDHIAQRSQRRLELINAVNADHEITCEHYSDYGNYLGRRRLRPIHVRRFTKDWKHHGRLYTVTDYGQQQYNSRVRRTIWFDGEPCIELDFKAMHPRMLYHLEGIDYPKDPYKLWGYKTTEAQRMLAKILMLAAINAKDRQGALKAAELECNLFTADSIKARAADKKRKLIMKRGDDLAKAEAAKRAKRDTGLKFSAIYDLALKVHRPIAHHFSSDAAFERLFFIDSEIALDVMHSFARQGIPILGVHDSFIVPRRYEQLLKTTMHRSYVRHVGFPSVIQ
jgi:hypothetical protein